MQTLIVLQFVSATLAAIAVTCLLVSAAIRSTLHLAVRAELMEVITEGVAQKSRWNRWAAIAVAGAALLQGAALLVTA